jgi:glycosyltransferase involved in cell wall biosynthesis
LSDALGGNGLHIGQWRNHKCLEAAFPANMVARPVGGVRSSSGMSGDQLSDRARAGRLAVLLATRNGSRFLDAQLRSVISQDWPEIDVHASDDGSTDATVSILENWAAIWTKGRFAIAPGPGAGFAGNFRHLLANAEVDADYVAFCDQDDIWLPEKTRFAAQSLAPYDGRPALYCARTIVTDVDDREIALSTLFRRRPEFSNALVQSIGGGNTMVMNRRAFELMREAARRTDFVSHDWFSYLIVSGAGGTVVYSPTPHVRYRQHGSNLVGANVSFRSRLRRAQLALKGRFSGWNDINVRALTACHDMLTPDAAAKFDSFCRARGGTLPERLVNLWRSGAHRQSAIGQVSLYVAGMLGKL